MRKTTIQTRQTITFPGYSGTRCLMMPYIQGEPDSVPVTYGLYWDIIGSVFIKKGDLGFLTIDESPVIAGKAHRGARAQHARALHTEAGKHPIKGGYQWAWGKKNRVTLDRDVRILLANNLDGSCAV